VVDLAAVELAWKALLDVAYPTDHNSRSKVSFDCCGGAIGGMWVLTGDSWKLVANVQTVLGKGCF